VSGTRGSQSRHGTNEREETMSVGGLGEGWRLPLSTDEGKSPTRKGLGGRGLAFRGKLISLTVHYKEQCGRGEKVGEEGGRLATHR